MADPTIHELAGYTVSGIALLVASFKRLQRKDDEHTKNEEKRREDAHQALLDAIKELRNEMRAQFAEHLREIRHLRETDIAQAGLIGGLEKSLQGLEKRIDGQGAAWRAELDRLAPRKLLTSGE